jgi:hypothetical protein
VTKADGTTERITARQHGDRDGQRAACALPIPGIAEADVFTANKGSQAPRQPMARWRAAAIWTSNEDGQRPIGARRDGVIGGGRGRL